MTLRDMLTQSVQTWAKLGHDSVFERYVVAEGMPPRLNAPLTTSEWDIVRRIANIGNYPVKQCFANSQRALMHFAWLMRSQDDPVTVDGHTLEYREGYVWDPTLIPIHHGWLELNGKVVDLTLRRERNRSRPVLQNRPCMGETGDIQYLGVPFSARQILTRITATKEWGSFLDDWKRDQPVIAPWVEAHPPLDILPKVLTMEVEKETTE
jgi:hypothetical protein